MPTKSLYVIDGFAQIFRAYYAIRGGMTSPATGEPTSAVFGFAGMLVKLLGQYQPDYVVVAFDSPGRGLRGEMYPEYKATRQPTPEDLTSQIPRIRELIAAFGIPVLLADGYEADDVIATLAHYVQHHEDIELRIVSKDKDLEQLLGERVVMVDVQNDTTLDAAGLLATKGVRPEQVVDMLTLMGDTSDNVPGVPGIGPKTAAQLVTEFGDLDNLLANLDQVKGKKRESIEASLSYLPLSRQLVTLVRDVPIEMDLEAMRTQPPALDRLLPLFEQLGFNRFREEVRRLAAEAGQAPPEPAPAEVVPTELAPPGSGRYRCVTTEPDLLAVTRALAGCDLLAVDTETTGLGRDADLVGISLAWEDGHGVYIPTLAPAGEAHLDADTVLAMLRPVLEDPSVPKCGHNVKFDAAVLRRQGVPLRGVVCDSMLAGMLLDPANSAYKLETMAEQLLGRAMIPIGELIDQQVQMSLFDEPGDGALPSSMEAVPLAKITPYAAEDAEVTLALCRKLLARLDEQGMGRLMREVEAPLTCVLAEMEHAGILCDTVELRRQGAALSVRVEELKAAIFEVVGHEFVIDSTKQLGNVLFDEIGLKEGRRTKTGRSTDIAVLERLAQEEDIEQPKTAVPRLVIEYRQLTKLISTYLTSLADATDPIDGRVRTTFHQMVTATGRLASQGPNLQNIPVRTDLGRQVRRAFVAPPGGVLLAADYSQVELRLLAHLSGDENLIEAFRQGADIHTWVASRVFGVPAEEVTREQRGHAKTINFGIIYGVTPYGLARRIPGLGNDGAVELIGDYKRRFPGIARFLGECVEMAQNQGYVSTILGRRRAIPEIRSTNGNTRSLGERLAINTVVQGSAADLIKVAMVHLQNRIEHDRLPLRMLLQIHDELILEAPAEQADDLAAVVQTEMEGAMALDVPLEAECGQGRDWLEAK
ncbi:MAG: DNA polymerase I [Armatimonadetes bacterium]|nr:DNA polymerase I [Armatimonadota bacterium]